MQIDGMSDLGAEKIIWNEDEKDKRSVWRKLCISEPRNLYCCQILEQSYHGEQGQGM